MNHSINSITGTSRAPDDAIKRICDPCTDKGIDDQKADHYAKREGQEYYFCRRCYNEYVNGEKGWDEIGVLPI